MANLYFQFKKFIVWQEHAAMKVSTDACIQAAWTISIFDKFCLNNIYRILDIGAGTGLLSFMLASEIPNARIVALEPNERAFIDLKRNIQDNKMENRIEPKQTSVQEFDSNEQFDLIICNPPFFENNLEAEEHSRNLARHDISLDKASLAKHLRKYLYPQGKASVMYPNNEWERWCTQAKHQDLHLHCQLSVQPNKTKSVNRMIGIFGFAQGPGIDHSGLTIYDDQHKYTDEFVGLLRPFYLKL